MKTPSLNLAGDLKSIASALKIRRKRVFLYVAAAAFVACTAFLAFNPSAAPSSPWFNNIFANSAVPYRSQLSNIFSYIFPNSTAGQPPENFSAGGGGGGSLGIESGNGTGSGDGASKSDLSVRNVTSGGIGAQRSGISAKNGTGSGVGASKSDLPVSNETSSGIGAQGSEISVKNGTVSGVGASKSDPGVKNGTVSGAKSSGKDEILMKDQGRNKTGIANSAKNETKSSVDSVKSGGLSLSTTAKNQTISKDRGDLKVNQVSASVRKGSGVAAKNESSKGNSTVSKSGGIGKIDKKGNSVEGKVSNFTASSQVKPVVARTIEDWINGMKGCDLFDGRWVKDDSYPLYSQGSCPHIDEPFNCYLNGRPDQAYQKIRWRPNGCEIPRLNPIDMLERLRGKRLVYVGDSLNRNMWESLVCILRNSVKDKSKVFEASGRREFRTVGSYSFIFKDYNCSVEYFRSPFLVREWEMPVNKGNPKETLRLDLIEQSSSKYKNADVIVFNTGHWWTHEKTAKGKDYYQEGNHIYGELNVLDAFHKALNTWAKWVDSNVNPKKTLVFFRGYSASHFSGGQWNSGGQCDKETAPITNDKYLKPYPSKMKVLESVIKGMKTPVSYMNITRMTDYRKDAHPSIYRKQNLTDEERRAPERYQDCSHWCLPGVPDSWNELLYAEFLVKQHQMSH